MDGGLCCRTWRAAVVAKCPSGLGNGDFGEADRDGIVPVHTSRERTPRRKMGAMQAAKPIGSAGGGLGKKPPESAASYLLSSGLIEPGGNPLLVAPAMVFLSELLEVPTPLDNLASLQESADQTERIDVRKRKYRQA